MYGITGPTMAWLTFELFLNTKLLELLNMNGLIWLLTDTDFAEEWAKASLFGKLELLYTTILMVILYPLNFLVFMDLIERAI